MTSPIEASTDVKSPGVNDVPDNNVPSVEAPSEGLDVLMSSPHDDVESADENVERTDLKSPQVQDPRRLLQIQQEMYQNYMGRLSTNEWPNPFTSEMSAAERCDTPIEPALCPSTDDENLETITSGNNELDILQAKLGAMKRTLDRKTKEGTMDAETKIEHLREIVELKDRIQQIEFSAAYNGVRLQDSDDGTEDYHMSDDNDESLFVAEESVPKKRGRKRTSKRDDASKTPRKRAKKTKVAGTFGAGDGGRDFSDGEADISDGEREEMKKMPKNILKTKERLKASKGQPSNLLNYGSLLGSNFVRDAHAVKNLPNQPTFSSNRRKDALDQLLASIPQENKGTARNDKKELDEALKYFPGKSVHPAEGLWRVDGMITHLKVYQTMAVGFMRKLEMGTEQPRGGILADEMGLGKTITMLANIVLGQSTTSRKDKTACRATLVVVTASLTQQWYDEVNKHCQRREQASRGLKTVVRHHSGHRAGLENMEEFLSQADIVITTYHELGRCFPKYEPPPDIVDQEQREIWWENYKAENLGMLLRIRWLRVVLDEAQAIKNHNSHISKACAEVDARHRWAITGTPLYNSTQEVYPYFRFLREPFTSSYKIFKLNFCESEDSLGNDKLAVMLRRFMIRRTHGDTYMGAKLLDLPLPEERVILLEFTPREKTVYDIVKKRFIERINLMLKRDNNPSHKQYKHIWTMILRLRQVCSNMSLVQSTLTELLEQEDLEKLERNDADTPSDMTGQVIELRQLLATNRGHRNADGIIETNASFRLGRAIAYDKTLAAGSFGRTQTIQSYLDALKRPDVLNAIEERTTCCYCTQQPKSPYITNCQHIYCYACATELVEDAASQGRDQAQCRECGELFVELNPCQTGATSAQAQNALYFTGAKGSDRDDQPVIISVKLLAVKAQILAWLEKSPNEKIIVYTQFVPVIDMLAKMCMAEGWSYAKHTGQMTTSARTAAIQDFAKVRQILLATLHSGGLGLNLTMASRVIDMDPWWNEAVERQAFARVHRIGQTCHTQMVRLLVKNSMDTNMRALQQHKQIEIDSLMDDVRAPQRRNLTELLSLFGRVEKDPDGIPFVIADDEEEGEREKPGLRVWEMVE